MASRLRAPGLSKAGVSKLARPGLKSPSGMRRNSPQPSAGPGSSDGGPKMATTRVGAATKPAAAAAAATTRQVRAAQPGNNAATGEVEVGDKVLINGKHGVVAFLGPTQFAKGSWAGVVLDTSEGKNNGSVNGVQYFECEPNRGLFAKPEKIQLVSKGGGAKLPPQRQSGPPQGQPAAGPSAAANVDVGDRVLVDGQKEGILGFLGETQFARGMWAGVILDLPDGKNDGTVNGVQYFECEQLHGLFTRPQKLKIISKAAANGDDSETTPLPEPSPPQQQQQQLQQQQQQRQEGHGQEKSPSLTPVDLKALHDQLNIGDHVLVGGVKEGILRFLGPTEFAKGVWVGVELPEPMGKNDGAISGKRYFQCEPKHGLFAPLPKVEKLATAGSEGVPSLPASSPASSPYHTPATQRNMGPAGDSLGHRHPSGSSNNSIGSGKFALGAGLQGTTAADLSFLLQEKDTEIETLQGTLDQREKEKVAHQEELTELRRQVDDLHFQLEEQGVISGDQLESATETNVEKLTGLGRELEEERRLTQQLRDQLKSTGGSDGELQSKLDARTQEVSAHLNTIAQLTEELEEARSKPAAEGVAAPAPGLDQELADIRQQLESERTRTTDLHQELSQTRQDLESERSCAISLKKELSETRQSLESEKARVASVEEEFAQSRASIEEERQHYSAIEQDHTHAKEGLQGASDRTSSLEAELAQMELTIKNLQEEATVTNLTMQEAMDMCSQHEGLIEERNKELNVLEDKIRQLTRDQELWVGEKSRLQSEVDRLVGERDKAISECDNLMTQSTTSSMEQSELSQQRRDLLSERDSLLTQQQAMHTEHEKLMSERDDLLQQLRELQAQKQDVLDLSQDINLKYSTAQGELIHAKTELKQLELELSRSREDWESDRLTLEEQMEIARASAAEVERRVSSVVIERDNTLQEAQELAERFEKARTERDELKAVLETSRGQIDELQFQLDELNTRHQSLEQDSTSEVLEVQQKLESTEVLLAERERELATAQEKLASLTDDLIASQGTHDMGLLEEEKQLLEERVKELTLQLEKSHERERRDSKALLAIMEKSDGEGENSSSSRLEEVQIQLLESQTEQENLLQEIEDFKQQTEFLNSVITDLQNKLEGVEAMKGLHGAMESVSDYVVDEDEDPLLDNLPPPRLFCDICDVFDQHDTDDCPMQTMPSDSPPHSMYHGAKAPGGSDRPYCENCEVFGHWTDECEYEATY